MAFIHSTKVAPKKRWSPEDNVELLFSTPFFLGTRKKVRTGYPFFLHAGYIFHGMRGFNAVALAVSFEQAEAALQVAGPGILGVMNSLNRHASWWCNTTAIFLHLLLQRMPQPTYASFLLPVP
jgi:hypothetical protein